MASTKKNGDSVLQSSDTATSTQTKCVYPASFQPSVCAVPVWLLNGKLQADTLKAEIAQCASGLSAKEDEARQSQGAELLYKTVTDIWRLETGQLSRSAADVACDEIRSVGRRG